MQPLIEAFLANFHRKDLNDAIYLHENHGNTIPQNNKSANIFQQYYPNIFISALEVADFDRFASNVVDSFISEVALSRSVFSQNYPINSIPFRRVFKNLRFFSLVFEIVPQYTYRF